MYYKMNLFIFLKVNEMVAETSQNYLFACFLGEKNVNQFLQEQNSSSSENTRTNFYPIGKCFCQNCKSLKIGANNKSVSKALQDISVPNF